MLKTLKYFCYGIRVVVKRNILGKKVPFIAGLVVGESCDLNCRHCSVSRSDFKNDLSFGEIRAGLEILYSQGIRLLAITGGEPFIWRDEQNNLESIVRAARKIGFLIISVYTNGTLPLKTAADDLFVSIDGLKETSNKLRGTL